MINATSVCIEKRQRTVLIVDDTPEDRTAYRRYLLKDEDWKYRVLEAGTGEEALTLSGEARPDCILLDYRLPDLNGLEILAALTRDCDEEICPVVMLTAEEDTAVAVAALKSGAQDYLNKNTLTPVDLIHAVNNAIERVTLRRENERQRRALIEQNRKMEEALAAQKLLDEDLRESRERLTGIIESAMDAIITVDDRQSIVLFNASAERMFGCPAAEAVGQSISRFIPQQARAAHETSVRQFGESGEASRRMGAPGMVSGLRASGEVFPVEASISQVEVGGQRLSTVILRDITERKRAEGILKRYELLSELARDIVLLVRPRDGRIIEANQGAAAAYGYDRETLLKMSIFELRAPGTLPDVAAVITKADAEGILIETLHLRKDGSVFPVEISSIGADIGGERLLLSVIRDITGRRQAEAALRESELRFRAAIENFPHSLIIYDGQRRFRYTNEWGMRLMGRDFSEIIGKRDEEIWPAEITNDYLPALDRAIETKMPQSFEWNPPPPTKARTMIVTYVPLCSEQGKVTQVLAIIYDITERKRIEQEREALLRREQQARQLAEDANRAKDEFLAVVTHELRSPLNAMLGYSRIQCAKREIDPEEARRAFETIRRNGERQKVLIDDLLDTARIITGKLRLEVGPVDLAGVINDAVEAVRPAADSKLILLTSNLGPLAGQVTGDAERLQQIAWNLLANAVKFTPEGGSIEVTLERVESRVTLTVSDTGQGIAPEFLPHIFDRFTQQDTSHSRRYSGLGLGLALVKELVEMHGGEIEARSAGVGEGSTFAITLPAAADKEAMRQVDKETRRWVDESALPPVPPPPRLPLLLEGVRVLLVDDEEDARGLFTKILEDSGANVASVSSAVEAFAMIIEPPQPNWPDVLICDIGMPEEDGYSLMRRVRDWEQGRDIHLPSVALTSLNRAEDRMSAIGAGFKMHISKPVEPEEMVAIVKSLAVYSGRAEGRRSKATTD